MSSDNFWAVIDAQLEELKAAATADDVCRVLAHERNPYGRADMSSADGFFAGSGGDGTVRESLLAAGWSGVWAGSSHAAEASYFWVMQAPNGDRITYVEGDIYRGDRRGNRR